MRFFWVQYNGRRLYQSLGGDNGECERGQSSTESTVALLVSIANPGRLSGRNVNRDSTSARSAIPGGVPGSTINAAILIDAQTPGANVYSIYTGAGPSLLGDITSDGTMTLADFISETTAYGEGFHANCSDCDTPTVEGAVCTNSGDHAGAWALYIRAQRICF